MERQPTSSSSSQSFRFPPASFILSTSSALCRLHSSLPRPSRADPLIFLLLLRLLLFRSDLPAPDPTACAYPVPTLEDEQLLNHLSITFKVRDIQADTRRCSSSVETLKRRINKLSVGEKTDPPTWNQLDEVSNPHNRVFACRGRFDGVDVPLTSPAVLLRFSSFFGFRLIRWRRPSSCRSRRVWRRSSVFPVRPRRSEPSPPRVSRRRRRRADPSTLRLGRRPRRGSGSPETENGPFKSPIVCRARLALSLTRLLARSLRSAVLPSPRLTSPSPRSLLPRPCLLRRPFSFSYMCVALGFSDAMDRSFLSPALRVRKRAQQICLTGLSLAAVRAASAWDERFIEACIEL